MDNYNNCLIRMDLALVFKIKLGKSIFLTLDVLYKLAAFSLVRDKDEMQEKIVDFFSDFSNLARFKDEYDLVEELLYNIYPNIRIKISKMYNLYQKNSKKDGLYINVYNLIFFLKELWPIMLENIINKNLLIYDYLKDDTYITKISISEKKVLKNYPEGTLPDIALEMFLEDLNVWSIYNGFEIKSADFKRLDLNNGESKLIIKI